MPAGTLSALSGGDRGATGRATACLPEELIMRTVGHALVTLALGASAFAGACKGRNASTSNGEVAAPPSANVSTTPAGTMPADSVANGKHHSKLGGAVAGAAVGHALGGHAVAGAAAGALIQHERNKHRRQ
jgi:hypothetical protein